MNKLEEVETGLEHDPDEIWTEYQDVKRDEWHELILPVLQVMPVVRLEGRGVHRRSVFEIRAGRLPHRRNRYALIAAAGDYARERLAQVGIDGRLDDVVACAVFVDLLRRAG